MRIALNCMPDSNPVSLATHLNGERDCADLAEGGVSVGHGSDGSPRSRPFWVCIELPALLPMPLAKSQPLSAISP